MLQLSEYYFALVLRRLLTSLKVVHAHCHLLNISKPLPHHQLCPSHLQHKSVIDL
ncbi:uncharacterized protein LACBIDRAFT_312835 [Laccaria bicolor S238N-H82]|uniref:Predicted protein n=1 Tax=Laccaria bicolor (strain S238N-H82 / ATCC MYA-4686) TaxID=486041 RepID=B0DWX0_LACBS|nr:uncharacterized protein LACBIDRAFT_312835 [Laccaria bicolor S238N-H82]EDR00883.1 predicted protein [Laccaria bicolor S238N-H82]|eukprot:XP_001888477.1 predicted protein [Laccaria bicolor S238N-H82]